MSLDVEPQTTQWASFFDKYARESIATAAASPSTDGDVSVVFDFFDLEKHDAKLAEYLLDCPMQALAHADEALKGFDVPDLPQGGRPRLVARVVNLPADARRSVSALRKSDLGKLRGVKGLVRRVTPVFPMLHEAVFQCRVCQNFLSVLQDDHLVLKEPLTCEEEQGGCGKDAKFDLVKDAARRGHLSKYVDVQRIDLQEPPDAVEGGREPQPLQVYVEGDLCARVWPGDRVTINGVLRVTQRTIGRVKSTVGEVWLDGSSFEVEKELHEAVVISPEEERRIREIARDPRRLDLLVQSFAPTIYGLYDAKLAILLQAFDGVEKRTADGVRRRGKSHILLVGDPGKAKTQILLAACDLSPRAVFANATTASKVGLTYTVLKDEKGLGGNQWVIAAGAAVLADRGLLALDELDKANDPEDVNVLLQSLESQKISVNKAGISTDLNARCAGLIAANFKDGRYDPHTPLADQVPFGAPLLSRMDCIFEIRDIVDEDEDREASRTNIRASVAGAYAAAAAAGHLPANADTAFGDESAAMAKPPIDRDLLRKYVAFAKRTVTPVLTREAAQRLEDEYVGFRQAKKGTESPIPLGLRQQEALGRLAEQAARARLSPFVEVEDVKVALRVFRAGYLRIATNEKGEIDMDRALGGTPMPQRDAIRLMLRVVGELSSGPPGTEPTEAAIVLEASSRGLSQQRAKAVFDHVVDRGRVFFTGLGWRPTSAQPRFTSTTNSDSEARRA